jgi:hypothetical protein
MPLPLEVNHITPLLNVGKQGGCGEHPLANPARQWGESALELALEIFLTALYVIVDDLY